MQCDQMVTLVIAYNILSDSVKWQFFEQFVSLAWKCCKVPRGESSLQHQLS